MKNRVCLGLVVCVLKLTISRLAPRLGLIGDLHDFGFLHRLILKLFVGESQIINLGHVFS